MWQTTIFRGFTDLHWQPNGQFHQPVDGNYTLFLTRQQFPKCGPNWDEKSLWYQFNIWLMLSEISEQTMWNCYNTSSGASRLHRRKRRLTVNLDQQLKWQLKICQNQKENISEENKRWDYQVHMQLRWRPRGLTTAYHCKISFTNFDCNIYWDSGSPTATDQELLTGYSPSLDIESIAYRMLPLPSDRVTPQYVSPIFFLHSPGYQPLRPRQWTRLMTPLNNQD